MDYKMIVESIDDSILSADAKVTLVENIQTMINQKVADVTVKIENEKKVFESNLQKEYDDKVELFYESERKNISNYIEDMKTEITKQLLPQYADSALVEQAVKMYRKIQNFLKESNKLFNIDPSKCSAEFELTESLENTKTELETTKMKYASLVEHGLKRDAYNEIADVKIKKNFSELVDTIHLESLDDKSVTDFKNTMDKIIENVTKANTVDIKKPLVKESKVVDSEKLNSKFKSIKESLLEPVKPIVKESTENVEFDIVEFYSKS